jgi:hypothetical protein
MGLHGLVGIAFLPFINPFAETYCIQVNYFRIVLKNILIMGTLTEISKDAVRIKLFTRDGIAIHLNTPSRYL